MVALKPGTTLDVMLHEPGGAGALSKLYEHAFKHAVELHLVTAFLTDWNADLKPSAACTRIRIIIGKDFGITRKAACRAVLAWCEADDRTEFRVATEITGFHPKLVLWREASGKRFLIVGSSNLTRAAFASNFEANVHLAIDEECFDRTLDWIETIDKRCRNVTRSWIDAYQEAERRRGSGGGKRRRTTKREPVVLPAASPHGKLLRDRRAQMKAYRAHAKGLLDLFRACASGQISNAAFYEQLPNYWSYDEGDRLQGYGWHITGAEANFRELSQAFVSIVDAKTDEERDEEVVRQLDDLDASENPARAAFFSEMLCLRFPALYPILNKPIRSFLRRSGFRARPNATEGQWYIDASCELRRVLTAEGKSYPVKNLAELDAVMESDDRRRRAAEIGG